MLPSCRHFWELQLGHRRFLAPRVRKTGAAQGVGPAAIQTARFQEAAGHRAFSLTPLLQGRKTGEKEKSLHLQRGKSSSASFTTARVPVKTTRSQTPAVPTAQPHGVYKSNTRGMGPEARPPSSKAVAGSVDWPQPVQGTGSPGPYKEERGENQPIETGYTWDPTRPHLGLDPEKTIQFELKRHASVHHGAAHSSPDTGTRLHNQRTREAHMVPLEHGPADHSATKNRR